MHVQIWCLFVRFESNLEQMEFLEEFGYELIDVVWDGSLALSANQYSWIGTEIMWITFRKTQLGRMIHVINHVNIGSCNGGTKPLPDSNVDL